LEEGIPITDPSFYASEDRCPNGLIEHVFRVAPQAREGLPLLPERIAIMREVGAILCAVSLWVCLCSPTLLNVSICAIQEYGGSFQGFIEAFQRRYNDDGTALQLVQMVTDTFPSFRDEHWFEGRRSQYSAHRIPLTAPSPIPILTWPTLDPVFFWKRAQILVAETWAAFSPRSDQDAHPLFPRGISQLTMFADYRVPQILHHLRLLTYSPALVRLLESRTELGTGAATREEVAIRAASIVAVERVAAALCADGRAGKGVCSVLVDFFLWDLAKRIEEGEDRVEGIKTQPMLPAHRIRCIWY
jgi:hypothetical protein